MNSAASVRPNPYPAPPTIADHIWLPFVLSLTGDKQHDERAIVSLAYILDINPHAIKARLADEMADKLAMAAALESPTVH